MDMGGNANFAGKWAKATFGAGLGVLSLSLVAAPLATAFAMPSEAAEQQAAEESAPAAAELTAEQIEEGRQLFNDWSCGACHSLSDAKAYGQIGPALDGNDNLDHDFTVSRITNGQGAMPAFGGQMSEEEIDAVSAYIVAVKK